MMKSPYETLHEQLKARFPRIVSGDSEVIDSIDSEHSVERLAPLYQLPAWQILGDLRDISRKLRAENLSGESLTCEASWARQRTTGTNTGCTDDGRLEIRTPDLAPRSR